jgi:hypothetical protein
MPCQLGREHRGSPRVAANQRLTHLPVQLNPLRPGKGGIDRLAVQVMAEPHAFGGRAGQVGVRGMGGEHPAVDRLLY